MSYLLGEGNLIPQSFDYNDKDKKGNPITVIDKSKSIQFLIRLVCAIYGKRLSEKESEKLYTDWSSRIGTTIAGIPVFSAKSHVLGFYDIISEYIKVYGNINETIAGQSIPGGSKLTAISKYVFFVLKRLKENYANIWESQSVFLSGLLCPNIYNYEYSLDNSLLSGQAIPKSPISFSNTEAIYQSQSIFFDPSTYRSFMELFKRYTFLILLNNYSDDLIEYTLSKNGIAKTYMDLILYQRGRDLSIGTSKHTRLTGNYSNVLGGIILGYCYDKDVALDITSNQMKYIEGGARIFADQFENGIPSNNPLKKGGIIEGTCDPQKKEIENLNDLIKILEKQLEEWKKVATKKSNVFDNKLMNPRSEPSPDSLDEYITRLEEEYKKLVKAAGNVDADKSAWEKERAELLAKIAELERLLKECDAEKLKLLAKIKELEDELAKLKAQQRDSQAMKDDIDNLKAEIEKLKKEIELLKQERDSLKKQLNDCNFIIASYEKNLELIKQKILLIYEDAKKLKASTTKLDTIEQGVKDLQAIVADILDSVVLKNDELSNTLAKIKAKINDEVKPDKVRVDLNEAVYEAVELAKQNENFYYKIVDDISRMLSQNLHGRLYGNPQRQMLLGQANGEVITTIKAMLENIHDLIRVFSDNTKDKEGHDQLDRIIDNIGQMNNDLRTTVVNVTKSRDDLINEMNDITALLEDKIAQIVGNLPTRDDIINEVMLRVKQLQEYYLRNAVQAVNTLKMKMFAPRTI